MGAAWGQRFLPSGNYIERKWCQRLGSNQQTPNFKDGRYTNSRHAGVRDSRITNGARDRLRTDKPGILKTGGMPIPITRALNLLLLSRGQRYMQRCALQARCSGSAPYPL